jgi:hypothetical protein
MYIGSDDGVYYLPTDSEGATPQQVLETGRVMRLTRFKTGNICGNIDRLVPSTGR